MKTKPKYKMGDLVRLKVPIDDVPAGTIGVICEPLSANAYLVEFPDHLEDFEDYLYVAIEDDLELVKSSDY